MQFPFIGRKKAATLGIGVRKLGKDMFIHRQGKARAALRAYLLFFFLAALYYNHHSLALSGSPQLIQHSPLEASSMLIRVKHTITFSPPLL